MRAHLIPLLAFFAVSPLSAADWLTLPSTYTHDPHTGERVAQYARPAPAYAPQPSYVTRSLYRHSRSTLQFGQSADNMHRVDRYGPPVEPYGEWRFPYRPFSAPYSQWGPPYAGLGFPYGRGGFGRPGRGGPRGGGYPFQPYPTDPEGPYPVPPWYDGYFPDYPNRPRPSDEDFFQRP